MDGVETKRRRIRPAGVEGSDTEVEVTLWVAARLGGDLIQIGRAHV